MCFIIGYLDLIQKYYQALKKNKVIVFKTVLVNKNDFFFIQKKNTLIIKIIYHILHSFF